MANTPVPVIHFYEGDLPPGFALDGALAIDCEAMGLIHGRDRLCLVQLSNGNGEAHLVQIKQGQRSAPNLQALIEAPRPAALMHFARFDLAALKGDLGITVPKVVCTKIASKLARSYTDRHGLRDLCGELIGVEISKQQQSSDWGADTLTQAQMAYAASDVLYLHRLWARLEDMLDREGRLSLANAHFDFLNTRAEMDLRGWAERDLFSHAG